MALAHCYGILRARLHYGCNNVTELDLQGVGDPQLLEGSLLRHLGLFQLLLERLSPLLLDPRGRGRRLSRAGSCIGNV